MPVSEPEGITEAAAVGAARSRSILLMGFGVPVIKRARRGYPLELLGRQLESGSLE
jgi:hypothetical protein